MQFTTFSEQPHPPIRAMVSVPYRFIAELTLTSSWLAAGLRGRHGRILVELISHRTNIASATSSDPMKLGSQLRVRISRPFGLPCSIYARRAKSCIAKCCSSRVCREFASSATPCAARRRGCRRVAILHLPALAAAVKSLGFCGFNQLSVLRKAELFCQSRDE